MTEKLDLDDIEANVSSWPVGYVMKTIVRRLVARIRELEADRDSWAEQASQRVADWEREHELRIAAERRVSELERASQPGGWEADLIALLPGAYYMDPPDGGSVTLLEQLQRMAEDAARWRTCEDLCMYFTDTIGDRLGISLPIPNAPAFKSTAEVFRWSIDAARAAMGGKE